MYAQFFFSNSTATSLQHDNYQKCVVIGNWAMLVSLFLVLVCVAISFVFEANFTIAEQVVAHIGTLIFAALFKIAYVIRCIGAQGLGSKWF